MLATLPLGTVIPYGENGDTNFGRQVQKILFEEREHVLIKPNFVFSLRNYLCKDLYDILAFGTTLGLENFGLDYEHRVTQKTLDMVGEAKRFLSREEYDYITSLGEKLRY